MLVRFEVRRVCAFAIKLISNVQGLCREHASVTCLA